MQPRALNHPIHDSCAHHTGYLCDLRETDAHQGGWTWHRTLRGALAQRDALETAGHVRASIYRILSNDTTEQAR